MLVLFELIHYSIAHNALLQPVCQVNLEWLAATQIVAVYNMLTFYMHEICRMPTVNVQCTTRNTRYCMPHFKAVNRSSVMNETKAISTAVTVHFFHGSLVRLPSSDIFNTTLHLTCKCNAM